MIGTYETLEDRSVIRISGEDKEAFLQGLITADITRLAKEKAIYALMLTPQGKYLFDFFIIKDGNDFLLEANKHRTPELIKKLTMYKLRSKVSLSHEENIAVLCVQGAEPEAAITYKDPRNSNLGYRAIIPIEGMQAFAVKNNLTKTESNEYERKRISLKTPEGEKDLISEKSFPLQFGMDELGAIDFDKGCYVGQEVTSRTKHTGVIRKKIYLVEGATNLPPAGTPIKAGELEIGELRSSSDNLGLALMRIEETEKARAEGTIVSINGITVIVG